MAMIIRPASQVIVEALSPDVVIDKSNNILINRIDQSIQIAAMGPQGTQGAQGFQGETGTQGIQGSTGAIGPQGIQGEQGEQGIQGEQGDQGIQGEAGIVDYSLVTRNDIGSELTYTEDNLTLITYSDGAIRSLVYLDGNLSQMIYINGATVIQKDFSYDVNGNLETVTIT